VHGIDDGCINLPNSLGHNFEHDKHIIPFGETSKEESLFFGSFSKRYDMQHQIMHDSLMQIDLIHVNFQRTNNMRIRKVAKEKT